MGVESASLSRCTNTTFVRFTTGRGPCSVCAGGLGRQTALVTALSLDMSLPLSKVGVDIGLTTNWFRDDEGADEDVVVRRSEDALDVMDAELAEVVREESNVVEALRMDELSTMDELWETGGAAP